MTQGVGVLPLIEGRVDVWFVSTINMCFEKTSGWVGYVKDRRFLPARIIDEKFRMEFRPADVGKVPDARIGSGATGDVIQRVNIKCGDECLRQLSVIAGDDWVKATAPEHMRQGRGPLKIV
jgi:hypothetical protein